MPLAVTVEASETYPENAAVTLEKLRKAAKPSVAITGSVGAVDLEDNSISNSNITSDAGIAISKLAGQTDNNILLVGDTSDGGGKKLITSAAPQGNAAIELSSGQAKITPSDETITGAKLDDKSADNAIAHLDATTSVASDDYVMVHDSSVTADTEVKLKKVTVNNIQSVGTTAYNLATIPTTAGSGANDFNVVVDLDGAAFQQIQLTGGKFYNFSIKAQTYAGANQVKTVSIRITHAGSGAATFSTEANSSSNNKWPAWVWPERAQGLGPQTLAAGKMGILSLTAFGSSDDSVVAAWIETS